MKIIFAGSHIRSTTAGDALFTPSFKWWSHYLTGPLGLHGVVPSCDKVNTSVGTLMDPAPVWSQASNQNWVLVLDAGGSGTGWLGFYHWQWVGIVPLPLFYPLKFLESYPGSSSKTDWELKPNWLFQIKLISVPFQAFKVSFCFFSVFIFQADHFLWIFIFFVSRKHIICFQVFFFP